MISFRLFLFSVFLFPVLVLSSERDQPDTSYLSVLDRDSTVLPWLRPAVSNHIRLSARAAIHGYLGLELHQESHVGVADTGQAEYWSQQSANAPESWQRFYFRFDSCFEENPSVSLSPVNFEPSDLFLSYNFSHSRSKEQDNDLICFYMRRDVKPGQGQFACRIFNSLDTALQYFMMVPIRLGIPYCVETHLSFFSADSALFECFIDGCQVGKKIFIHHTRLDFIQTKLLAFQSISRNRLLAFDDFELSTKRIYSIPPLPKTYQTVIHPDTLYFLTDTFTSSYTGEKQIAARWRLTDSDGLHTPVFDAIDLDPYFYHMRFLPFSLSDGSYSWCVSRQNQFGAWSNWSPPQPFRFERKKPPEIIIQDVLFAKNTLGKKISKLTTGAWYSLHVQLQPTPLLDSLSYLVVWLSDSTYTFGHQGNKGGAFLSSSNYVYNLSFGNPPVLFEKSVENSIQTTKVPPNGKGLYLDARDVFVDRKSGVIRFSARVLEQATIGRWHLKAYVVYRHQGEQQSNLFQSTIQLMPSALNLAILFIISGLTLVLIIGLMIWRYKRYSRILSQDVSLNQDYERIAQYLQANLDQKLSVDKIRLKLGISQHRFHQLLRSRNQTLPELLTCLKIERAKELLSTTDLSIAEISDSLNFNMGNYFAKVFKQETGLSPLDFRRKSRSCSNLS